MPTSVSMLAGKVLLQSGKVAVDGCCCGGGITFACDQISASKTKCGYPPLDNTQAAPSCGGTGVMINLGAGTFLTATKALCCTGQDGWVGGTVATNPNAIYHKRITTCTPCPTPSDCGAPSCATCCSSNGTAFVLTDQIDPSNCGYSGFDNGVSPNSDWLETCTILGVNGRCTTGQSHDSIVGPAPLGNTGTIVISSADEYTTTELKSNTVSALPAYDGVYDDTCQASRELSSDELSYSIARFKVQFTFGASGVNRTLHYNEHFVPDVGSPSDTARAVAVLAGLTSIIGPEVMEPTSNGVVTIASTGIHFTTP